MLPLKVCKYLFDITQACDLLRQFTNGKTIAAMSRPHSLLTAPRETALGQSGLL
jgi:hypothetical protein